MAPAVLRKDASMALLGKAVMINWSDVPPEHRAEYYAWHDREHMQGRLRVPGFHRGRRHLALAADRDIFNLYEVEDLAVLTSGAYAALTENPSEATRRVGTFIVNAFRALAHVRYTSGVGIGGFVHTLRFDSAPGAERTLGELLRGRALPAAVGRPGVVAAHWCVADQAASTVVTAERRGRPTAVPRWSIIVEGVCAEALRDAVSGALPDEALREAGAAGAIAHGSYVLQRSIARADVA
jgi:hypothetical protein